MPGNGFRPHGQLWMRQEWGAEMLREGGRGRVGHVCSRISCIKATRAKSELPFHFAGGLW